MNNQSSAEIANEIANKENELATALENELKVEQEILLLQREILTLQSKKKDLELTSSKAKHLVKKINIELRLLKGQFWSSKNAGL